MILSVEKIYRIAITVKRIVEMNEGFPPVWDLAMTPNARTLNKATKWFRDNDVKMNKEVDLPLIKISIKDLPDKVPQNTIKVLEPLLHDYIEVDDEEIKFEDLFINQKAKNNGKATKKPSDTTKN